MKFKSYLIEKRSHPELNKKVGLLDIMKKYLSDSQNHYLLSFTDIDKIGINPKYGYNTPLGIYLYILTPETYNMIKNRTTFATDRPYVTIAKMNNNKILIFLYYTESDFNSDVEKLRKFYPKDEFNTITKNTSLYNFNPGERIWRLSYALARLKKQTKTDTLATSTEVYKILHKELGYNGALSLGDGVIHPNEPFQFVAFSTEAFKVIDRVENKLEYVNNIESFSEFLNIVDENKSNDRVLHELIDNIILYLSPVRTQNKFKGFTNHAKFIVNFDERTVMSIPNFNKFRSTINFKLLYRFISLMSRINTKFSNLHYLIIGLKDLLSPNEFEISMVDYMVNYYYMYVEGNPTSQEDIEKKIYSMTTYINSTERNEISRKVWKEIKDEV
jgi:hypothetical protein